MEEWVGKVWDNVITRSVNNASYKDRVLLENLSEQLSPFYRALGGGQGKSIVPADGRSLKIQLTMLQKIAGSHRKFSVCWQDHQCLCLPKIIDFFPVQQLNESLYFWLTALAAQQLEMNTELNKYDLQNFWFKENQKHCCQLIDKRPGLKKLYLQLLPEVLALRPSLAGLKGDILARELAIRKALIYPGSIDKIPVAAGDPYPVILWIYPPPIQCAYVSPEDNHKMFDESNEPTLSQAYLPKKQGQRIDDSKETDGLLVFQLESLFSWTEHIQLDRPEDDADEENVGAAAEDMDIITVARQRRNSAAKIKFDIDLPAAENDDLPIGSGIKLPEWNYKKKKHINAFCLLQPMLADNAEPASLPSHLEPLVESAKKNFSMLQPDKTWLKRQPYGDELDLDSWLSIKTDPQKSMDKQHYYKQKISRHRDLSCLLLADLSLSTDAMITSDIRVIDIIRDTIHVFAEMLANSRDEFSIYGFSSIRNKLIRYHLLKNFSEPYTDFCRGRINDIKPGYYTRMGAAIRQSSNILKIQKTQHKLMLIISDGKPNDSDHYEARYGIEDTKDAIMQAKKLGLKPFCITIDHSAGEYMPYLFGSNGFVVINNVLALPNILPKLYFNLTI